VTKKNSWAITTISRQKVEAEDAFGSKERVENEEDFFFVDNGIFSLE